jgi:hypothetical protein
VPRLGHDVVHVLQPIVGNNPLPFRLAYGQIARTRGEYGAEESLRSTNAENVKLTIEIVTSKAIIAIPYWHLLARVESALSCSAVRWSG